jgi:hypothetical protein
LAEAMANEWATFGTAPPGRDMVSDDRPTAYALRESAYEQEGVSIVIIPSEIQIFFVLSFFIVGFVTFCTFSKIFSLLFQNE